MERKPLESPLATTRAAAPRTQYGSMPTVTMKRTNAWFKRHALPIAVGAAIALSFGICVVHHVTFDAASTSPAATTQLSSSSHSSVFVVETGFASGHMSQPIDHTQFRTTASHDYSPSYIVVDSSKTFQDIIGFGGAFTEASALQLQRLPQSKQDDIIRLYFSQASDGGAAYSLGRVPMNSCDFSPSSYSFDDVENDTLLLYFDMSVAHDTDAMIPFIQRALRLRPDLKLFLSPWSPPAWMKLPDASGKHNMLGSAQPYGLNPAYRSSWALYFSKFISAYKSYGINFWALTPQNEPQQPAPWEACLYDDSYQAAFIADFLGPTIRRDHPHVKILIFDHNRGNVHLWAQGVYNHSNVEPYVDGVAFHWYDNTRDLDGVQNHEHVNQTHHLDPTKLLLATEAAHCPGVASGPQAWDRGLRYAHDILQDLSHHASGWVDWNLILDHEGGPNKLGNTCDAPIIVHPDGQDFTVQPMYHFIKHFSGYLPPGSKRVYSSVHVSFASMATTTGDVGSLEPRFPAGAYGCDRSSRQRIVRTPDSKLQVANSKFCIDVVPEPWLGNRIELVECQYTSNSWSFDGSDSTVKFAVPRKAGRDKEDGQEYECLTHRNGALEDGGRLTLEPCTDLAAQTWTFVGGEGTGTPPALVNPSSQHCVTAGYAFVQAVAFDTPQQQRVLVVLNEHPTEDATFDVVDKHPHARAVATVVPKGSIRTFVWST
ncbi:hypothetical protein H310_13452 [Aphanomyces invadans]|uniref:Uncharacterized protein n=1 Tax=Aphanomyces invadans TaxID=157072 RepID=A0A024TDX7_9STRA|nr:hypothetical protein H310_13452 [Aphanomyces invadans]ETV92219.1 hypothetical protein H310_13452 [Aphanomyces invadans]|eukprot:XP_008879183.1 hypothetical protein H310_13452 [Aphanomyces invadans]